ncbi:transposase [Bacillus sp. FSL W8-1122]|nr:transposase [Shouchella clausii]
MIIFNPHIHNTPDFFPSNLSHNTSLTPFPSSHFWQSIYSNNLIETFNKQLKKYSKGKETFPSEPSIKRFLVSQFKPYNQTFSTRCPLGFDLARTELVSMFKRGK